MNHILRDIKLSELTDTPMSDGASKFNKFWDDLWSDMEVSINVDKEEIKCWKDGCDYYYFLQEDKNDHLWCDYDKVWSFPRYDLGLEYGETQELVQYMMDKTLNCRLNTPIPAMAITSKAVDKTLNK